MDQPELDRQNRAAKTQLSGQSRGRTARSGQPGQASLDTTSRKEQTKKDILNKTARKRQPE
jgi:hypothetical protein